LNCFAAIIYNIEQG